MRWRRAGTLATLGLFMVAGGALQGPVAMAPALASSRGEAAGALQLFYTPPVLARAGQRVLVPVDVVCATARGTACQATVALAARTGSEAWRPIEVPAVKGLRFDLTAVAARAIGSGAAGRVDFFLSARDASGRTTSLGSPSAPLSFFVVRRLPVVRVPAVPFGQVRHGRTVLSLPWGSGALRAGLQPGIEGATAGPSSFDVDREGRVYLADVLQRRVAVFDRGRLERQIGIDAEADASVAVGSGREVFVVDQRAGSLRLRSVGSGSTSAPAVDLGPGIPSEVRVAAGHAVVDQLPLAAWTGAATAAGLSAPTVGRPLDDGTHLLRVVSPRGVRIARFDGDRPLSAVELSLPEAFGDVALAEPDGGSGFVVVVHVWRQGLDPADQYQVVHVAGQSVAETFAVANVHFAHAPPYARFRLGPGGLLYQLVSTPSDVQVQRYRLQGVSR